MPAPSPYAAALKAIPRRDRDITILGGTTHIAEYGPVDAPRTVVVVHGFRGDHHGLEPVVAHLPEMRIIAPDLPGFGASDPLVGRAHDLAGYVEWLDALLVALKVRGTAVLLGHSFGSIVVAAALAHGVPAPRSVLINPIGQPALAGPRGILTRAAVTFYQLGAILPPRAGFALLRSRVVTRVMSISMAKTSQKDLKRWIHEEHDRYFSSFASRSSLLESFQTSVSNDVSGFAAKVHVPTLLIAAELDDITPLDAQHRLARLFPDARLVVVPDVGHLVHYEAPVAASRAIREFLA
jgi:pimeloyl-ACP methyl ester carboxylesterase